MKNILFIAPPHSEFSDSLAPALQVDYRLLSANSIEEVLEISNNSQLDLVLIDWSFPERQELLKMNLWHSVPKMFFGTQEDEAQLIALLDQGLGEVCLKSERQTMILAKIRKMIQDNTYIKQQNLTLERFKAIADYSSNFETFRDVNNKIIYCSPSVERIMGYTPQEYIEVPLEQLVHPADLEIVQESFRRLMKGEQMGSLVFRLFRKDGDVVWFDGTSRVVYSENGEFIGYRISAHDITGMRMMEEALKESEARYKLIADFTADWEVYRDVNGKMLYCSPAVERLMGYTAEEFIQDMPLDQYIHPNDVSRAMSNMGDLLQHKSIQSDIYHFIHKNGESVYVEISAQAVFIDGDVCQGFRFSGRDVTEKVMLEAELRKMNQDKNRFMAIISHDLRSPFNALIGFSELLLHTREDLSDEEQKEYTSILYTTSKNTLALLDDLLLWSSSQSGKINMNLKKVNLSPIIHEAFSYVESASQKKNIELLSNFHEDIFVRADSNMLNTILRNLVSNAVKFTQEGGRIEISTIVEGNTIEIAVSDNGLGMDENVKNALFTSDDNQSSLGTAYEKGTGLGLVLCKEFVENQNGRIWVESEKGKGSTFRFTLPQFIEETKEVSK